MDNKKIHFIEKKQTKKKIKNYIEKISEDNNSSLDLNNYDNDLDLLRKMYMNIDFNHRKLYTQYIHEKVSSYTNQDKIKNRDLNYIITCDETIEKLLESKLKCYYCKNKLVLLNENKLQKNMWTLDRINNNLSHTNINTCISCLKCNLQKRSRNHNDFKFTKQLIIKKNDK